MQSVAVHGNYVYAVHGGALWVLDVSNPALPVEVGKSDRLRQGSLEGPWSIVVAHSYAYVAGGDPDLKLRIIDISDPTAPAGVGFYSQPHAFALDVAVADKQVYVASTDGLEIVDVADPAAPIKIGSYRTAPGIGSSVAVTGQYAVLGAQYPDDLRVIDISDPTAPVQLSRDTPNSDARAVTVAGYLVYALDEYHAGLRVVDISDPTNPVQVDFYDLVVADGFDALVAVDGTVYVGAGQAGLYILRHTASAD